MVRAAKNDIADVCSNTNYPGAAEPQAQGVDAESLCTDGTLRELASSHFTNQSVESQSTKISTGGQQLQGTLTANTSWQRGNSGNGGSRL
jgi:hypothetical protein